MLAIHVEISRSLNIYPHQRESITIWKVFHVWSSSVVLMPSQNSYSCLSQGALDWKSAILRLHLSVCSVVCAIFHSCPLTHPSNNYPYFLSEIVFSCFPVVWLLAMPLWLIQFIAQIKICIFFFVSFSLHVWTVFH